MAIDAKLEKYLSDLDRALKALPVSERSDIVTEIKSHALSAQDRDPQASQDTILHALGEAETVANRYLFERGHIPVKPPISPIVKWLVIGFLGTLALVLLFVGAVIYKVTSSFETVDGRSGAYSIFARIKEEFDEREFKGSQTLSASEGKNVEIRFNNGKFELENSQDDLVRWSCKAKKSEKSRVKFTPLSQGNSSTALALDFTAYSGINCSVSIPVGAKLAVQGTNGKVDVDEPHYGLNLVLSNGKVGFHPDEKTSYRYTLSVGNGKVDEFQSSQDPGAYLVSVRLGNGKISNE